MNSYIKLGVGIVAVAAAVIFSVRPAEKVSVITLMNEEVNAKLSSWQSRRAKDCRDRAMSLAVARADSMILAYAREQKMMIDRPSRPVRPEEPELRRPSDTLQLKPFLSDSLD